MLDLGGNTTGNQVYGDFNYMLNYAARISSYVHVKLAVTSCCEKLY